MTYYRYKERENPLQSQIDWGSITKNITDGIEKEAARRSELKTKIETQYVKNLNTVQNFSTGLSATRNQQVQRFAGNARDFIYEQNRLLKAGQIDPTQYQIAMQGTIDSFTLMNENAKGFNEKLQKISDAGGNINQYLAERGADFANLEDKQFIFDPETGVGSFAKLDSNGNIIRSSITPITKLGELMENPYPDFDMTASISDAVKNLKNYVVAQGPYRNVSDVRQNKELYDKWKESRIDSIMASSMGGVLIADRYLGLEVTDNYQEAISNPDKYIFADNDGGTLKFKLVGDQAEKIRERIGNELEMAIGREEEQRAPSAAQQKMWADERSKKQAFGMVKEALSGDEGAMRSLAIEAGLGGFEVVGDKMVITSKEGRKLPPIDLKQGIAQAGKELASRVGLSGQKFTNQYGNITDLVNLDAMSRYEPLVEPGEKIAPLSAKELQDVYQPFQMIENEDTGVMERIPFSNQDIIAIAKSKGEELLASRNITGWSIDDVTGQVTYNGKVVGNATEGSQWVQNIVNEVNNASTDEGVLD